MTRKNRYGLLIVIMIGIFGSLYWFSDSTETKLLKSTRSHKSPLSPTQGESGREMPFKEIKKGEKVFFVNRPDPKWKSSLENFLKDQGGEMLEDVKIEHERSFVWTRDGQPLRVESVVITLTDKRKSQSHFRAMIDPQTSKILETWDKTIFEPVDKKEGFRFKLDPRYSTTN
jgi:hypothetical protein